MVNAEVELTTIAKIKKKRGEPTQEYYARLAEGARTIPDADWEALSSDAQSWVNAATKAQDDGKPIAAFEAEEAEAEEAETETEEESAAETEHEEEAEMASNGNSGETTKTRKKKAVVKAKAPTKAPAAKKLKAAPKEGKVSKAPRTASARRYLKEQIIKNPKTPIEELTEKLSKAGYKLSELSLLSIYRDTQNTLRIANELGVYKRDV